LYFDVPGMSRKWHRLHSCSITGDAQLPVKRQQKGTCLLHIETCQHILHSLTPRAATSIHCQPSPILRLFYLCRLTCLWYMLCADHQLNTRIFLVNPCWTLAGSAAIKMIYTAVSYASLLAGAAFKGTTGLGRCSDLNG
jgi:hypothetical protein